MLSTHRWFVACAVINLALFGWMVTGGTGRFLLKEPLGDFYDYQAASMLHGRLDVPYEGITLETFVFQGKTYGYFGLTPAVLRLPLVALGIGFGKVSRIYQVAYFGAVLLAAYSLLLHARQIVGAAHQRPSPRLVVLFMANAGLGNTLFFLSSRSYAYHEAILCGAAFTLWTLDCSLRHLARPDGRWWIGAVACALFAVHARAPMGLYALTICGLVACVLGYRGWHLNRTAPAFSVLSSLRRPLLLGILLIVALLTFNGVSYVKFRTFNGHPLEYNAEYTPERLARFEGRHFHFSNLPFGIDTFLLRPSVQVSKYFPYLEIIKPPADQAFPKAKLDWIEPTLALPYAMPALFLLATVGCAFTSLSFSSTRLAMAIVWLAILPMAAALIGGIAVSHRYTADFCPLLLCAAGFALAGIEQAAPLRQRIVLLGAAGLTPVSIAVTFALTLRYQGEQCWGVEETTRTRYAELRQTCDRLFGVVNPAGYATTQLFCRKIDAAYNWTLFAALFQQPDKRPEAIALYQRELLTQPFFAEPHFWMSDLYSEQQDIPRAAEALRLGLAIDPRLPQPQAKMAELLTRLNRPTEAVEHYERALQIDPKFFGAHNNVALLYAQMGKVDQAIKHLEIACQLEPNNAMVQKNLADLRAATARAR